MNLHSGLCNLCLCGLGLCSMAMARAMLGVLCFKQVLRDSFLQQ